MRKPARITTPHIELSSDPAENFLTVDGRPGRTWRSRETSPSRERRRRRRRRPVPRARRAADTAEPPDVRPLCDGCSPCRSQGIASERSPASAADASECLATIDDFAGGGTRKRQQQLRSVDGAGGAALAPRFRGHWWSIVRLRDGCSAGHIVSRGGRDLSRVYRA